MQQAQNQRDNRRTCHEVARAAGLALFIFVVAPFARASQTSSTIDPTFKYAWGTVAGYVNFAPANGGLAITDSSVTGYAWGANTGWINFSAAHGGVTNTSAGVLGGYAWDSGGGWVSFAGVTIDSSGKFHGTATGGTVNGASYALNFDCAKCDVRTDWRPASSRTTTTITSSSGGNGAISPIIITTVSITSTASTSPVAPPASPLPATRSISGKHTPSARNIVSTTTAASSTIHAIPTAFKRTAVSSTTHATTTTGKPASHSFFSLIRSIAWSVYSGILRFLRFFWRF